MNRTPLLFLNVLVIATCGLVYELLAGTVASYLLGDSVTQFSLVIGVYLFALGVGAWLSGFVGDGLARAFIEVELGVALLGGLSAPLLLVSFSRVGYFYPLLFGMVFGVGVLVGLELPLLMRIVKDQLDFKEMVARVLAFDYVGALVASLLFPILLVPRLGLVRTALVFGMVNAAVGLWGTWLLGPLLPRGVTGLRARAVGVMVLLAVAIIKSESLSAFAEEGLYPDEIVYTQTTPYQKIVITKGRAGFQLYLNGHLQFASADEYRYHEALVHPAASLAGSPRRVLILGGGDGLALREVLKHPSVEAVTLVDLDPAMTLLSERFRPLSDLNRNAFQDPRVAVVNEDAFIWVDRPGPAYEMAVIDFPDPSNFALGKLYTSRFFKMLQRRLAPGGVVAIQCTSPLFARQSFWCVVRTMESAGWSVRPYHAAVPSFGGVWGFALARREPFERPGRVPGVELRYLDDAVLASLFVLPPDIGPVPVEVNRLDNQVLVRYHDAEWKRYE
jgi:spermidine synthase